MEEEFFGNDLIDRFEQMLEENEHYYFDGEELNEIISYYLDVGDLPFAYKAIEYALQLHPESYEMKIKVLEYLLEVGMLKEASELIDELKEVAKSSLDFVIAQARFWSLKEQHKLAINFYEKALEYGVEEDYIHHCLGGECIAINEIGKALFHYKSALELELDDDLAFYACVQCFNEIHRHKECIDFLKQYIEVRPYADFAWFQLGLQYERQKDFENALEAFDYAVCINPKSINNLIKLAKCHEKMENHTKAIEVYEEALEIDDTPAYTMIEIANCYINKKESSKALAYYHKAIHSDPQLDRAWSLTSELYEKLGNTEEAIHYLKRAVELDAMNMAYWKRLTYLHVQAGMYEEAEQNYAKIIKLEPNHFLNWLGYTELLIILGEYKRAISIAEKGLKRFERAELYYQISCCEYLLNDNKRGLNSLIRAKKLNPKLMDEMFAKYPILKMKSREV